MAKVFAALLKDSDLAYTPRAPEFLKLAADHLSNFATDSDRFDSVLNSLLTALPPPDIVNTTLDPQLAVMAAPVSGLQTDNEADAAGALADLVKVGQAPSDDAAKAGSVPLPPNWLVTFGSKQAAETAARTFRAAVVAPQGETMVGQSVSQWLDQLSNLFK